MRLSRLFSGPHPIGLSVLQHWDLLGSTRWTGGKEGLAQLRSAWPHWQVSAAFCSSSSHLPLGQGSQKNLGSFCSDSNKLNTVAPQEEEEDEESFGTLSDKYSSRRLFHKSTAKQDASGSGRKPWESSRSYGGNRTQQDQMSMEQEWL